MRQAEVHTEEGGVGQAGNNRENGFTVLELVIAMVFLILIGGALAALGRFTAVAINQGSAKSQAINAARYGIDTLARETRNSLVAINTLPNTPLGVNFDLNDPLSGQPLVRDAIIFYFDGNGSARLIDLNGDGLIDNLGLDDGNGDGQPDLIGIGLVPQEVFGNGAQDFIDTDFNKQSNDLNGDGAIDDADKLWRLVQLRFDSVAQITDTARWRSAQTIARNIFLRKRDGTKPLTSDNITTIQFASTGEGAISYDSDKNGWLSESEIGNSENGNAKIDTASEVKRIGAILINLDIAVDFDSGRRMAATSISCVIKPRAFEINATNLITRLPDLVTAANIN